MSITPEQADILHHLNHALDALTDRVSAEADALLRELADPYRQLVDVKDVPTAAPGKGRRGYGFEHAIQDAVPGQLYVWEAPRDRDAYAYSAYLWRTYRRLYPRLTIGVGHDQTITFRIND